MLSPVKILFLCAAVALAEPIRRGPWTGIAGLQARDDCQAICDLGSINCCRCVCSAGNAPGDYDTCYGACCEEMQCPPVKE